MAEHKQADARKESKNKQANVQTESVRTPVTDVSPLPYDPSILSRLNEVDHETRVRVINGLQRTTGNAAVQRIIASSHSTHTPQESEEESEEEAEEVQVEQNLPQVAGGSGSDVVQRDPVTLNPVVISNDPERQAQLQQQSDQMMARFPEVWRGFCRDWYDASLNALATVSDPPDPYAAANFYKALAGNLLWAATSITVIGITGGAAAPIVITASVLGAGAGSGTFSTAAPPSGRPTVGRLLANERDRLEQRGNRALFADVVQRCLDDSTAATDQAAQDRMLWDQFASGINFDSRATVMLQNAEQRLSSWLQQFQTQYMEWKAREDVIAKAREYELANEYSGPFPDIINIVADEIGVGTPADPFFEMAKQDIPLALAFSG